MRSDEDSDSDGDEDEDTAELLRELEKIKRERAEEKARLEREQSASTAAVREAEIATANPLLNLAAALGQQAPKGVSTTVPGTFAVKKRWDDGASSYGWDKLTTNSSTHTRPHIQESSHDIARQVWSIRERFIADRIPQVRSFFIFSIFPSQAYLDRKFMAKFIKVTPIRRQCYMKQHLNVIFPVIDREILGLVSASPPQPFPIPPQSPCMVTIDPKPIPWQPILAFPFQNIPDLSCTSTHAERYRVFLAWDLDAMVDSIQDSMYFLPASQHGRVRSIAEGVVSQTKTWVGVVLSSCSVSRGPLWS